MRSLVPFWNWLKCTVRSSVAAYRPTGMLTSPKASAPVQIERAIRPPCEHPWTPSGLPGHVPVPHAHDHQLCLLICACSSVPAHLCLLICACSSVPAHWACLLGLLI